MRKKKRGRKSLLILNATLEKQICTLLSQGVPIGATCDTVGISARTYHGWIEKGEADPDSPYAHFVRSTMRARGRARVALLQKVTASDDWRAHAWILSHVWPNEFSERAPEQQENGQSLSVRYFLQSNKSLTELLDFPHVTQQEPTPLPDSDDDVDVDDVDDDLNEDKF